jgi:hypothetical protein
LRRRRIGVAAAGFALAASVAAVPVLTAPTSATAATRVIYVAVNGNDDNPGTKARPLATIWHASGKARPGDTVMVRGGVYYLKNTQYIASRGTSRAPILYRSAPGERAVIDGSRTSDGNLLDIRGQYNIIRGFEVRHAKNFGIITLGAMHSTIVGNFVHSSWQSAIGIEGGKIGGDPNPWTVGMRVISNVVYNNVLSKKYKPKADSAPVVHADYAQDVSFLNNRIVQNHQIGLELAIVRGATVAGNTMYDNELHLHLDNASDVTVRDNFLYRVKSKPTNTGIQTANIDWKDSNPLRNITVRNNVILGGSFGFMYGTYGRGGGLKNVTFEQNTIYGATGWTLLIVADPGHSGSVFRRNIFVKGEATKNVDVPKVAGLRFERNCWSGGPAGNAKGPGDVNATPRFVKAGGLTAASYRQRAGSPCAGMGATPGASSSKAAATAPRTAAAASAKAAADASAAAAAKAAAAKAAKASKAAAQVASKASGSATASARSGATTAATGSGSAPGRVVSPAVAPASERGLLDDTSRSVVALVAGLTVLFLVTGFGVAGRRSRVHKASVAAHRR